MKEAKATFRVSFLGIAIFLLLVPFWVFHGRADADTDSPSDGYNLFAPIGSKTTYLMDNDGNTMHSWSSDYRPGLAVYLLADGTLLRTANTVDTTFNVGGAGGRVERFNWSGSRGCGNSSTRAISTVCITTSRCFPTGMC